MTIDKNSGSPFLSASEYILDNFEPIDRIAMLVLNRDLGEILQRRFQCAGDESRISGVAAL